MSTLDADVNATEEPYALIAPVRFGGCRQASKIRRLAAVTRSGEQRGKGQGRGASWIRPFDDSLIRPERQGARATPTPTPSPTPSLSIRPAPTTVRTPQRSGRGSQIRWDRLLSGPSRNWDLRRTPQPSPQRVAPESTLEMRRSVPPTAGLPPRARGRAHLQAPTPHHVRDAGTEGDEEVPG